MTRLQPPGRVPPMVKKTTSRSESSGIFKMQAFLMAILGICVLLTAYVNLASTSATIMDMHHYGAAVNQAIEDFKRGSSSTSSMQKQQPAEEREQFSTTNNNNNNNRGTPPQSKIASLSCAKHGGPADEFAQEMVYWSDVPSDALYASPLKQKRGQQKQYMTFEPDGGE